LAKWPGTSHSDSNNNGSLIAPSFILCAREAVKKNPTLRAIFVDSLEKNFADQSNIPTRILCAITYSLLTDQTDLGQPRLLQDQFKKIIDDHSIDPKLLESYQKALDNQDLRAQLQSWGALTQALVDTGSIAHHSPLSDLLALNKNDLSLADVNQVIDTLSEKIKDNWMNQHPQQAHVVPMPRISATPPSQNLSQTPSSSYSAFNDIEPLNIESIEPIEKKSSVEEAKMRQEILTYMTKRSGWTGNRSYCGKRLLHKLFPKNLSQKAQQDPKVWEKAQMRARVVFECMREAGRNHDNPDHVFLFHGEKKGPFKNAFNPDDLNRFFDDVLAVGVQDPVFLKSFLRELTDVTWPAPIRKIAWLQLKTYAQTNPTLLKAIESSIVEHMQDRKNGHGYRSIGRSDAVLFLMQQYDVDEQKEFIDRLAGYLTDRRMTGHLALDITHGLKRALPLEQQKQPLAQAEPIKKLLEALRINLSKRSISEANIRRQKLLRWGIYLAPLSRKIDSTPIDDSFDDEADDEPMIIDIEGWKPPSPTSTYQSSSSQDVDEAGHTDQPLIFDADEDQEESDISSRTAPKSSSRRPAPDRTKNDSKDGFSSREVFDNLDGGGYPLDQKPFTPYMRPVLSPSPQAALNSFSSVDQFEYIDEGDYERTKTTFFPFATFKREKTTPAREVSYRYAEEQSLVLNDAAPTSPSRRPAPSRPISGKSDSKRNNDESIVVEDFNWEAYASTLAAVPLPEETIVSPDLLDEDIAAFQAAMKLFAEDIQQQPDENHLVTAAPMILDIEAARVALGDPASSQDEALNDQLLIEVAQKKFQTDDWEDALEDDPIHFSQVFLTAYLDHLNLISLPIVGDLMISPDQDASVWEVIQSEIMSPYLAWLGAIEDSADVTEKLKAAPAIFEALTPLNQAYKGFTASIEALNEVRIAQQLDAINQAFEAIKTHIHKLNRTLALASVIAQAARIERSDRKTI